MKALDSIITTTGINSSVVEDDECVGHIMLLDYDQQGTFNAAREETANLPGVNAFFRSSPGSYHCWNLSVRSRDDTACRMLETHTDAKHVAIGYRKRRWTLRVAGKYHERGDGEKEEYKPAPELMDVWWNPTDLPQSHPHWEILGAIADRQEYGDLHNLMMVDVEDWRGNRSEVESYLSITDDMKDEIR